MGASDKSDRAGGATPLSPCGSQPKALIPSADHRCPSCGGPSRFEGRCGACIAADYEDFDDGDLCDCCGETWDMCKFNFDCGLMPDGTCMLAGTEDCDWECPYHG